MTTEQEPDPSEQTEVRWRPLHLLVAIFIGLMLLVGSLDVTMRYAFDAPLSWGGPVVGLFLGLTIFSGMIIVTGEDEHITVGLLDRWIVGRRRKIQSILVYVVSIGSMFFISERMLASSLRSYENENQHMMIDISVWPFSAIFAVLSFISGLLLLRNLFRLLTKRDKAV
ncbi:MAG: TRAP transporter small permease subunit [Alphaproteobacteria bacterium]|nr:TRAP transporter small permease subunit [Alphaproteobacteria bacterium]